MPRRAKAPGAGTGVMVTDQEARPPESPPALSEMERVQVPEPPRPPKMESRLTRVSLVARTPVKRLVVAVGVGDVTADGGVGQRLSRCRKVESRSCRQRDEAEATRSYRRS